MKILIKGAGDLATGNRIETVRSRSSDFDDRDRTAPYGKGERLLCQGRYMTGGRL